MFRVVFKSFVLLLIFGSSQKFSENEKYYPFAALQAAFRTLPVVDASQEKEPYIPIHRPGPALKEWRLNTNFDNVDNWPGLRGFENCSQNIYEFAGWSREPIVVTLPRHFTGKQIILPTSGHLVFQEGVNSFLPLPDQPVQSNCRGREVKFSRVRRSDWFDPDNWVHYENPEKSKSYASLPVFEAIPHLERVPCQYDSVNFPENSTFHLKISGNVTISSFMIAKQKKSYTDVAILMNSALGKVQFLKEPETVFLITSNASSNSAADSCSGSNSEITDSDQCICAHYTVANMKRKICALADCNGNSDVDEQCPSPITPHGFCCPICGFHVKIRHSGNLRLVPLYSKLKSEISKAGLNRNITAHVNRYKPRLAHIIVVAKSPPVSQSGPSEHIDNGLLRQIGRLVLKFEDILKNEESEVLGISLSESWGDLLSSGDSIWSGENSDRLAGSDIGGGVITLIVFLCLIALLAGLVLFIFIWNKNHTHDPLTLSTVTSMFSRVPSMRMPMVPGSGSTRRSSTLSNSLYSFGFARFTNERGSSVTISRGDEDEESSSTDKKEKSSSIRRAEQVDDGPLPVTSETAMESEKVSDANSGQFGFSSVSYDLLAGVEAGKESEKPAGQPAMPLLTIPEVVVVDMDDKGVHVGNLVPEKPIAKETKPEQPSTSKEKSIGKKLLKPGFIASKLAGSYKKFGPEIDEGEKESDKKTDTAGAMTDLIPQMNAEKQEILQEPEADTTNVQTGESALAVQANIEEAKIIDLEE